MQTGQKIKEIRTRLGMTQQELALKAKVNLRTIQRIENGEVIPRSYTLKIIASVLNIEAAELFDLNLLESEQETPKRHKAMLIWLHLGAIFFLPSFLIWFFEKEHDLDIKHHGADVINFQLSMLAILLPCLFFPGLPQLIALFTIIVILINTIRVITGKSYHYPLAARILGHK
ncbi:helix-turn-helix domain-containing protein [Dyadobacter sp. CY323]|uniref:helix-turn-helix domain-containing protein n=1 Tax=Dyadobacter sp. CY323 TaxID=2907302 RepID=UPI001F312B12|nr:helix-turn-helix domain-containing protein [Dyadobacter sp. CY323]MCE6991440.1 helix-turn-helix domain-containing protein [Dyadobacter sp. CY323]